MSRHANGEGSIWRRKDGRWVGATYAATNTGGRKRVHVYGKTRALDQGHSLCGVGRMQAREKLTELQRELDRGVRVPVENWTVGEYLDHWLSDVVKPSRAPKTHQGYELVVRRHITPRIGRKKLRTLGVHDVRAVVEELQQQGMGR